MSYLSIVYTLISLYLLIGIVYFGSKRVGYSSVRQTISELEK